MKICKSCGRNLEDDKFAIASRRNGKIYRRGICNECRQLSRNNNKKSEKPFNLESKKIEKEKQDYNFNKDEIIILKDIIKNYTEINLFIEDKTNRTAKTFNIDLDILERVNKFTKENRMQSFSDSLNLLLSKSLELLKY